MKLIRFGATVLVSLWATLSMAQATGNTEPTFKTYKKVPAYVLQDLAGNKFLARDVQQKNKKLAVVFFSPTCGHCIAFTEELTSNLKRIIQPVQYLYVSAYPPKDMKTFAATQGLLKMPAFKLGHDVDYALVRFYLLKDLPAIFLYDKQGKLVQHFDAKLKIDDLIHAINQ